MEINLFYFLPKRPKCVIQIYPGAKPMQNGFALKKGHYFAHFRPKQDFFFFRSQWRTDR